ncbi:hypothetical protein ASPSYDRAFT_705242 [Aspergillus sydowii CBS 593.65]|uniref:Uncharacterized protein n=1 Tax=Aspergillus sydowii CBS 593.65 TaxID=1036612 RepID=A0A1L9SZB5_9EURO|nr:uncharacterized protein ASPSYDRAFT_705242 [Aspergillus sydowii CBS 593.65]OJJ52505.1 hypothetical protein ASPSYDRAFT_705242 [Aspergillus sydowii CBS 593.65]
MIIGSVWHGVGENKSANSRRNIYSMHMVKDCLRQDENQFLAIHRDVVKSHPLEVQQLIGYSVS